MSVSTIERVPGNTADSVNDQISRRTADSVRWHAQHPDRIDARLSELDREWDIERTLEANAAAIGLAGTALGLLVDKRFLAVPLAVSGFLLQHAVQGWCPPLPLLRRKGIRTSREIDEERVALKALRGDFAGIRPGPAAGDTAAGHALQAARL